MPYVNGILVNLVSNPELKVTQSGKYICNFGVANNCGYGEYKKTDFIICNAFGKTAQIISTHLKKGDAVILQGEFHNKPYKKNDKGYDVPNWQYEVHSIVFLPKQKSVSSEEFEEISPEDFFQTKTVAAGIEIEDSEIDNSLPF